MYNVFECIVETYLLLGLWKLFISLTVKKRTVKEAVELIDKNGLVLYE